MPTRLMRREFRKKCIQFEACVEQVGLRQVPAFRLFKALFDAEPFHLYSSKLPQTGVVNAGWLSGEAGLIRSLGNEKNGKKVVCEKPFVFSH